MRELSDDEVFGSAAKELSDAEVFGTPEPSKPEGPGFLSQVLTTAIKASPLRFTPVGQQLVAADNNTPPGGSVFNNPAVQAELRNNAPAFDFATASQARRALDDQAERQAQFGTIGPIEGPQATPSTIVQGLASDLVAGGKGVRAGLRQMAGDVFDSQYMLDQAAKERAQVDLMNAVNTPQFETDEARGVYSGLSSTLRQAPSIAAAIATRNPNVALGTMVAPMVPEEYGKFRQRGGTPLESLAGATGTAATEYLTEKLPMGFLVRQFGRAGAGQFLTGLLAREIPGEQVATLVQDAIDTAVANPDKTWGEYLAERPDAAYQTLLATVTQTALMGGANTIANRLQQPTQADARAPLPTPQPAPAPAPQPQQPIDPQAVQRILGAINQAAPTQELTDAQVFGTQPESATIAQADTTPAPGATPVANTAAGNAELAAPVEPAAIEPQGALNTQLDQPGQPGPGAGGSQPTQAAPILQNRNRATPSSIAQMQSIAGNPDYGRLGFSRDFANGAPVVAGGQVAPEQLGRTDVAVASDGRRIPVQYAVIEAADVLTSNRADGTPNLEYGNQAIDRVRAIAGNGRIAGLQAAYQRGTTGAYISELSDDALHGVNPDVIRSMRAPVLVRVMPTDQVTADIGDVSNTVGNLNLSPVEQANNDAQRVNLDTLQFSEDGSITPEAVRQFVRAMPQAEQGGLVDTNGQPTKQAVDRINAAVFAKAYGNDQLIRLYAQAQDPEARLILSALAQVAPKMARLEGAGALDVRGVVTQAAEIAVNARRQGISLQRISQQADMAADPDVGTVLNLFARNARTNKPVVEALSRAADFAYTEANKPAEDMFGEVPRASRGDVINELGAQDERASQETLENPAGGQPVGQDAGRQATEPAGPATPAEAQEGGTGQEEGLNPAQETAADYNVSEPLDFTDDGQLQLFLDNGPDESQAGPRGEAAQRAAVAAVDDIRSTETVLGLALSRDYAARQRVSLVGQRVSSAEDLAVLAQVYRDPRFETFRVFFVNNDGELLSQVGLTSRLPASTTAIVGNDLDAYLRGISDMARMRGATGYYLLHNHPSGIAQPSRNDILLTQAFAKKMPGLQLQSHVVIDTNEYTAIDGSGQFETRQKDFGQSKPMTFGEWGGYAIDSPEDAMALAKRLQSDPNAITLINLDNQLGVKGVTTIPASAITADRQANRRIVLRAAMRQEGARVIAVGRNMEALKRVGREVVDSIHVSDSGQVSSLAAMGVAGFQELFPTSRRTRVSPDTSREFNYLRTLSQQPPAQLQAAEPAPDLIIQHSLSTENLLHAAKMGGLAVPSLAVTRKDQGLTTFGEITLLGSRDMADPKGYASTRVFGADIYSPRYPKVERELDRKAYSDFGKKFGPMARRMGTSLPDMQSLEREGQRELERDLAVMGQFLVDQGMEPTLIQRPGMAPQREARLREFGLGPFMDATDAFELRQNPEFTRAALAEIIDTYEQLDGKRATLIQKLKTDEDVQANFVRDVANEVVTAAKLRSRPEVDRYDTQRAIESQIKDAGLADAYQDYVASELDALTKRERIFQGFTYSGNRKYTAHTLENVVKILKKELRGGESFNYGVGSLRAQFTPQFRSVAQIRENRDRLVSAEQFEEIKKEVDAEFIRVAQLIDPDLSLDTGVNILEDAAKMGVKRAAAKYGYDVSDDAATDIGQFLNKLRTLPTAYFEAKILRDVSLSEFSGAVVPEGVSPKALKVLEDAGITNIRTYTKGDDASRKAAIDELATELQDQGENTLFDIPQLSDNPLSLLPDPARANVLAKLKALEKRLDSGKITAEQYRAGVQDVIERIEQRNETKLERSIAKGRERGPDWIVERLMRAKRKGELDAETVDFTLWLLEKNPALAEDLGIGLPDGKNSGAAGDYNPATRVIRLFKSKANTTTGVHEILHHTERMMPVNVQNGILKEYRKAWTAAYEKADEATQGLLRDMLAASAGDEQARRNVMAAFKDGRLNYDTHYPLYNASEFWAVNATDILSKRYGAQGSWIGQAKRWLSEMLEYIKGALGLRSDAPLLRGLRAVINGDGQRITRMLNNSDGVLNDMPQDGEQDPTPSEPRRSGNRDALGRVKFKLGEVAFHKLDAATRPLQVAFGMRMASPELRKQLRKMKATIDEANRRAGEVAQEMSAMTEADREMVSDIVEKMVKPGVVPPEYAVKVADAITNAMDRQTDELVSLGMLSEDSADRWRGRYLPRIYNRKTELDIDSDLAALKNMFKSGRPTMQGIGGGSLKGRGLFQEVSVDSVDQWLDMGYEVRDPHWKLVQGKLELVDKNAPQVAREQVTVWRDWTPAERAEMGENRDAMMRFVQGYTNMQRDIALGRLFNNIANNPEWVRRSGAEGWVQVPNTEIPDTGGVKRYGNLAGLWVRKDVMSHLTQFEEAADDALQIYRQALGIWKEGKTALNPVAHFNNIMGNVSMAHFAGVSYWDGHKYVGAVRDFVNDAPMLNEAREAGLFTGSFTKEELKDNLPPELQKMMEMDDSKLQKAGSQVLNALTFWLRKPLRNAYEFEDSYFKYLIYRDARNQGMSPEDSVDYALRYVFTYDDLPSGARKVRDYAIPFFAWTYKAIPALLHTAMVYPWRLAAPAAVLHSINLVAYALAAGDEDDNWLEKLAKGRELEQEEREVLPERMQGMGMLANPKSIRLGTDSVTGHPIYLDASRVVPGGDMFDMTNQAGGLPIPAPFMPNHPILSAFSAMIANKELFFGREIVDKNDTAAEAAEKRAKWMAGFMLPAVAPGGYHSQRILDATANAMDTVITTPLGEFTGVDRSGLPVQPKFAAMQTVGIKARPVDLDLEAQRRKSQEAALINSIAAEVRSMARLHQKGAVSDDMMDRTREKAREKIDRIRDEQ